MQEKKMKKTGIASVMVVVIVFALSCLLPALAQEDEPKPDLTITEIEAYHYYDEEDDTPKGEPWFNLENYIDVTVENTGDADAEAFYVSLYINDEFFDKKEVSSLEAGESTVVHFEWTPIGDDCFEDCTFTDTSEVYELKAVADCDNAIINESDDENNDLIEEITACYNGYIADEPLENVAHGTLHGGLIFTTGDGEYGGLYSVGDTIDTTYEITLPAGASVELARLNVYYTWCKPEHSCPEMEISIDGTVVPLNVSYNDIKCHCPGASWVLAWGNYIYDLDLTDYIAGSGTYTVTVENVCTECESFCIAAPGIVLVYEDENSPMIEYWINEGADVIMGGGEERPDGGFLALEECLNSATFPEPEEPVDLEVEKATLGVVSLWGDDEKNVLYFNGEELGEGVYCGYHDPCSSDEEIDGILMDIEASEAQVGMAAFDVTDYLEDYDNEVIQGDDGDNMMPVNAFLVITYEKEPTANRTLPAESVSAGESITIVIEAVQHGYSAQVIETLPEGFVYVDSTLEQESVEVGDNTVKFELGDKHSFNYTVKVQAPESEGTYTFSGILIVEDNEYEVDGDKEIEVTPGHPNITAWNPLDAVVNNTEGESRTFNISVNQIVDISWLIDGTEVQTNENVTEAAYTNISAVVGIWDVSVIATNTATGLSVLHTWIWNVTSEFTAGISDLNTEIEEGQGQEIITVENITTTPTPATEEKQKQKLGAEEEAPVPGFGLVISLFILIAIAYIRIRYKNKDKGKKKGEVLK